MLIDKLDPNPATAEDPEDAQQDQGNKQADPLDEGMLLQIDACVVYAISDGMYDVEQVLYSDLRVDSPYNTYKYEGLPAGAICNPGITSIKAAMNPEKHNYLYYHTDEDKKDGSHIFSETLAQHQQ